MMVDWPKILGGVLVLPAITWAIVEIREDGARSAKTAIERQNNDRPAALIRSAMIVSATSIPRLSSVDGGGAVRCFRTSALRALA
ncbi:hypothetical protein CN244_30775 [Sinorhizobium medicae]|nr:hypothetical protein CN244_30775 [Sinorhizobium medicae]